ncbi:MAG TPA: ester cyclase [Roseiflexaceae bacterium]|nr:ester cyclase [Roseiflexaceae bacterium]
MAAQDALSIAREHYDGYNRRDFARVAELIAADAAWHNVATGEMFHGPEGYLQFINGWSEAMPDSTVQVTNLAAAGEVVVCEFTGRGTHTGPLMTPAGPVPPTGRTVDVPFCEVLQVRGGKIVGARTYFDSATMMRQLGLIG